MRRISKLVSLWPPCGRAPGLCCCGSRNSILQTVQDFYHMMQETVKNLWCKTAKFLINVLVLEQHFPIARTGGYMMGLQKIKECGGCGGLAN